MYLKTRLTYKKDLALAILNNLLSLMSSLVLIILLYTQMETLNGWTFWELIFLTSFFRMVLGFQTFLFFAPVFLGRDHILSGRLDRILVRPLNALYQVYSNMINLNNFTGAMAAFLMLIYSAVQLEIELTFYKLLYGILAVTSSIIMLAGIFLLLGSMAFWTGRSRSFFSIVWRVRDFSQYPITIYPGAIKLFLTTLMPVAFASYFPVTFLLGKPESLTFQLLTLVAGPVFFYLSYRFWRFGLSRYSSTGS